MIPMNTIYNEMGIRETELFVISVSSVSHLEKI